MTKDDEILAFIHIAKTAGSSLNYALELNVFAGRTCGVYDGNLPTSLRSETGVYEGKDAADLFHRAVSGIPIGRVPGAELIGPHQPRDIRFVCGHMRYGMHAFMSQPVTYMTFVRDPVDRVVSAFNYVRSLDLLPLDYPIEEFLDIDFLGNSDAMVRQLVADKTLDSNKDPALRPDARSVTAEDFEAAVDAIKSRFIFAAPTDRYDTAIAYLALRKNLPVGKLIAAPQNITSKEVPRPAITDEIRERILEVNKWDARLFEFSVSDFDNRVSQLSQRDKKILNAMTPLLSLYRVVSSEQGDAEGLTGSFQEIARCIEDLRELEPIDSSDNAEPQAEQPFLSSLRSVARRFLR